MNFRFFVRFMWIGVGFLLVFMSSAPAYSRSEDPTIVLEEDEELCANILFGGFVTNPNSNQIWYRKIHFIRKKTDGANDGSIPNYFDPVCSKLAIELVPLNSGVESTSGLINIGAAHQKITSFPGNPSNQKTLDYRYRYARAVRPSFRKIISSSYFLSTNPDNPNNNVILAGAGPEKREIIHHDVNGVIYFNKSYKYHENKKFEKAWNFVHGMDGEVGKYDSEHTLSLDISESIFITSNNCWHISSSLKNEGTIDNSIKARLELSDRGKNAQVRDKVMWIRSLYFEFPSKSNVLNDENGYCETPAFEKNSNDPQNRDNRTNLDNHQSDQTERTIFRLADFPNYRDGVYYSDTNFIGLDFDAKSKSPGKLEVVSQKGFLKRMDSEKYLGGDLIYKRFSRIGAIPKAHKFRPKPWGDPKISLEHEINITKNCEEKFKGWESSPKFSSDGELIYFLAASDQGDDASKKNLFTLKLDDILSGTYSCNEYATNLTSKIEFDEPILWYKISSDKRQLVLQFEKKGETIVRFFVTNPSNGKILYEQPYQLGGVGFIYDITKINTRNNFNDEVAYYVMASKLDFPTSIYKCKLLSNRFHCEDEPSIDRTSKLGREILENSKVERVRLKTVRPYITSSQNRQNIHTYTLNPPKSKNNKRIIISIHGGPNESWNGLFSLRDYLLAEAGYKIYMPNPLGSTGFGFDYSEASKLNWGKGIYNDVRDVISYVSEHEKDAEQIVIVGISFGGYMISWLHARPDYDKGDVLSSIDAMVQINPAYNLKHFSISTDQLWFPEFQLNCSGSDCKLKSDCEIPYNPYCNKYRKNISVDPKIPTFVLSGLHDQRIPCENVLELVDDFRATGVPFKEAGLQEEHGIGFIKNYKIASRVDSWLTKLNGFQSLDCSIPLHRDLFSNCHSPQILKQSDGLSVYHCK